MAKQGIAIAGVDQTKLLDLLLKAQAEEWMAYYQYWYAAKMVKGFQRANIEAEFEKHAKEEKEHADWVADRIIELGGIPVQYPNQWQEISPEGYAIALSDNSLDWLTTICKAEQLAIKRYQEIVEFTEGKDFVTNSLAKKILAEEVAHEQDMQDYYDDIIALKDDLRKL